MKNYSTPHKNENKITDADGFKEEEFDFEEEIIEEEGRNRKRSSAAIWLLSAGIHALLIGALVYLVIEGKQKKEDIVITTTTIVEEEEELEEEKEIEILKEKVEITDEVIVETPVVTTEEVVENEMQTENEMEAETAEGVTDAISDMPLVGSGLMGNIGGGGGGGGAFGQRMGGGKKKAVMKNGGSKATESAVDWALWWLANHQEADGHWDVGKYEGTGSPENDMGCTGLALLAFLGAGYTDSVGKFSDNVKRGLDWVIKNQRDTGAFADKNYANGICTMAVAEALGMGSKDKRLRNATQKAVDYLLAQQNPSGGFFYQGPNGNGEPSQFDDMSLIGWCIMGLKSAMLAGVKEKEIVDCFKKVGELLDKSRNTKDNTSLTKGDAWYRAAQVEKESGAGSSMQAIAMLVRQYLGWKRSESWLSAAAKGQMTKFPRPKYLHIYRTYYSYLALFQQGGQEWKTWNESVTPIVLGDQRQDGDFRGSWNPGGGHIHHGGRVLSTAMLALSLEIYYRYQTVMK